MKIALGNDHRGTEAKQQIKAILSQMNHEVIDLGADNSDPMDYPDSAYLASKAVASGEADRAILICGTGIGMCIAANKIKGIRAALCHDELGAQICRHHNDANVLCLSGDLIGDVLLRKMVEIWIDTEFQGGRHQRRVTKISAIEDDVDPREITNGQ